MSKKGTRRHIAEAVLDETDRVDHLNEDALVVHRRGRLRKRELKAVAKELDIWSELWSTQHARAWRSHIRDHIGTDADDPPSRRFTASELADIRSAVNGHGIDDAEGGFAGP